MFMARMSTVMPPSTLEALAYGACPPQRKAKRGFAEHPSTEPVTRRIKWATSLVCCGRKMHPGRCSLSCPVYYDASELLYAGFLESTTWSGTCASSSLQYAVTS